MEPINSNNYIDIDFLIAYIHKGSGISTVIIKKVIYAEEQYMKEKGLIVEFED